VFSERRTRYGILGPDAAAGISELFEGLENDLIARSGADPSAVTVIRTFDGRLFGQGWETPFVPVPNGPLGPEEIGQLIATFHDLYEQRNGHRFASFPVEGVTYRVQVVVPSDKVVYETLPTRTTGAVQPVAHTPLAHLYDDGAEAACYERADLLAGDTLAGPAIVWETNSTTFVPRGRTATVGSFGELVVR